jgi:hypothetical protein
MATCCKGREATSMEEKSPEKEFQGIYQEKGF